MTAAADDRGGAAFDADDAFPNDELEITAWCEGGIVMAVRHKRLPHVQGVQFHPESIITDVHQDIMRDPMCVPYCATACL